MKNTVQFRSRKDASKFLAEQGIDTSDWTDIDWLKINSSAAEIHISRLAECVWDAINESTPKKLQPGEWHIPYGDKIDNREIFNAHYKIHDIPADYTVIVKTQEYKLKIATARLARISYETLGDNPKIDYAADVKLHDDLLEMEHLSPLEHCAKAMTMEENDRYIRGEVDIHFDEFVGNVVDDVSDYAKGWCRNFKGFIQYREEAELKSQIQKILR
jgi:hypothetical protein